MRIFVVEDSPIIRQRIAKILANLTDLEIVGEADGVRDALSLILRLNPDVVLLDLELSDGLGYDVLRNLQQADSHVWVVVLTNFVDPIYREKAFQAGANYFLDKSTEFDKLVPIFQNLIHHSPKPGS